MTISDIYKKSVIDEAKRTIARVDATLAHRRLAPDDDASVPPPEGDLETRRAAYKQKLGLLERTVTEVGTLQNQVATLQLETSNLRAEVNKLKSDLLDSLKAVGGLAEEITGRMDDQLKAAKAPAKETELEKLLDKRRA
jgi:hypothetical protein